MVTQGRADVGAKAAISGTSSTVIRVVRIFLVNFISLRPFESARNTS